MTVTDRAGWLPPGVTPRGREYVLTLPYAAPPPPLNANYRGHWRPRHEVTAQLRRDVSTLARQAGLHRLTGVRHITVCLRWAPGTRHRRDAGNCYPMSKVCIDALTPDRTTVRRVKGALKVTHHVGVGLVPDDVPAWVTELTPVIVVPPARGMWLHVWVDHEGVDRS